MPYIKNKTATDEVDLFYNDYGTGAPVILIHGWPLSSKSWEGQIPALVEAGYRVIAYDRRGFGQSSAPWSGYDYDALAGDLNEIISQLNLENVTIVGFSMGGGEVVRYLTNYGDSKISKAVLIASIIPLVKQKDDNPAGVPEEALKEIDQALHDDRVGFLKEFHKGFYSYGLLNKSVSEAQLDYDFSIASHASPQATIEAARSWANTDFRPELKNVTVKTLIVHGDADKTVPIETSADQAAKGIADNIYKVIEGAPHGLNVTHKKELNAILRDFLSA